MAAPTRSGRQVYDREGEWVWDSLPFDPSPALEPRPLTFGEYVSWCPEAKFERVEGQRDSGWGRHRGIIRTGRLRTDRARGPPLRAADDENTLSSVPARYEILSRVGVGGMGIVFKARDRETGSGEIEENLIRRVDNPPLFTLTPLAFAPTGHGCARRRAKGQGPIPKPSERNGPDR